jgi:hypothetical protein
MASLHSLDGRLLLAARTYLGVHDPSDVAAGALLGTLVRFRRGGG